MKKELEDKLIAKYSYMFNGLDEHIDSYKKSNALMITLLSAKDKKESEAIIKELRNIKPYNPIAEGISCDDGWYNLLDKLMGNIEKLDVDKKLRVIQIKEKFGGLRFYVNDYIDDNVFNLISTVEQESFNICEICGNPGRLRSNGHWLKTLCDEHKRPNDVICKDD